MTKYKLYNSQFETKGRLEIHQGNVRLMQLTELNEVKMSGGANEEVIFDTSLIEMVK